MQRNIRSLLIVNRILTGNISKMIFAKTSIKIATAIFSSPNARLSSSVSHSYDNSGRLFFIFQAFLCCRRQSSAAEAGRGSFFNPCNNLLFVIPHFRFSPLQRTVSYRRLDKCHVYSWTTTIADALINSVSVVQYAAHEMAVKGLILLTQ